MRHKGLLAFLIFDIIVIVFTICHAVIVLSQRAQPANWASQPDGTVYNWYYQPRNDGKQPEEPPEFAFIKNYDSYWLDSGSDNVIYLTFDGGYDNGNTQLILDVLEKHNAPAAFFLVGHYISANPELVKRMLQQGHLVCNHSTHHKNMAKIVDFNAFKVEMEGVEQLYFEATGEKMSKYFRPPEGRFSERCLSYAQQLGYKTIFWSFAYADWSNNNQPSESTAIKTILSRTHPGMVVLLHSTSSTNAKVLDSVITQWEDMGYTLKSLDEFPFEG